MSINYRSHKLYETDKGGSDKLAPDRKKYLDGLLAQRNETGTTSLPEDVVKGLTREDLKYLQDHNFDNIEARESEAFLMATTGGLRGLFKRALNRTPMAELENRSKQATRSLAAAEKFSPGDNQIDLRKKTLVEMFGDDDSDRVIAIAHKDLPPSKATWGYVMVDGSKSINENAAFIKEHLQEAKRQAEMIDQELKAAQAEIDGMGVDVVNLKLIRLSPNAMEDVISGNFKWLTVEEYVKQAQALAKRLKKKSARFAKNPVGTPNVTLVAGKTRAYFSNDAYNIDLDVTGVDWAQVERLESIMLADDPSKLSHLRSDTEPEEVIADEVVNFEITRFCRANGYSDDRYLVDRGEEFTEPDANYGNFEVKIGATRKEIERHMARWMPMAVNIARQKNAETTDGIEGLLEEKGFRSYVLLGTEDTEPSEATWGRIIVDKNKTPEENMAFVESHIEQAWSVRDAIEKKIYNSARDIYENMLKNEDFEFRSWILDTDMKKIQERNMTGKGLTVDEYVKAMKRFAETLKSNHQRFEFFDMGKTKIALVPGYSSGKFDHRHYDLQLNMDSPHGALLDQLEGILRAQTLKEGMERAGSEFKDVEPRTLTEFDVAYVCRGQEFKSVRHLVGVDDVFTEPDEHGRFCVKIGSTHEEIYDHVVKMKYRALSNHNDDLDRLFQETLRRMKF